ncbi:hypothetical protein SAMN02746041_03044 [Desulfacinum hydrothermale DSM 13146]|uniref:Uncharacterized protein n=1 Tax=Desulfacinum hydrothermale DSM 13146 TaxID=1121390 RepID=A0A1W1XUS8_9BACT|nr:hypothetical protein [Desulfacinum hydrothermale]SMC27709.1 hypothetical protein SAMN02746041_03044 [Desulfacinum hydrothermale DSM 13146]
MEPLSLEAIRTTSLFDRPSKVAARDLAKPWVAGGRLKDFLACLPAQLAAKDLVEAVQAVADAVWDGRTVLLGMGAHPIKVGLAPVIIDAMESGILKGVALNGAGVIHDVEMALAGKTSEDVGAHLSLGRFGMARETAEFINGAVSRPGNVGRVGFGEAVGRALLEADPPYARFSILSAAARLGIPVTVHVAMGTDIIHMHPSMDGAAAGAASHLDFRIFCRLVSNLRKGVYINLGSAVVLPEVFLKAVSVAANLGYDLSGLTTLNMDFMRHYRPQVNVVERPTAGKGRGFSLVGHHEILFPLFCAALKEALADKGGPAPAGAPPDSTGEAS